MQYIAPKGRLPTLFSATAFKRVENAVELINVQESMIEQ